MLIGTTITLSIMVRVIKVAYNDIFFAIANGLVEDDTIIKGFGHLKRDSTLKHKMDQIFARKHFTEKLRMLYFDYVPNISS